MKRNQPIKIVSTCRTALVLLAVIAGTAAQNAAAQNLEGRVVVRPLTPEELKDPSLAGLQGASGLSTVGIGQPVYLEALVNSAFPASNVVNVNWSLTQKPLGSAAVLTASPLGTNIPLYEIKDRDSSRVAGRIVLRPDIPGVVDPTHNEKYTVTATIITTTSGITNISQDITAGTYLGSFACGFCHGGGPLAPDKYEAWEGTGHASMFARGIDGLVSDHYSQNCISCHTVGYDTNTNAVNGGFDDVAAQVGWTFPSVLTNGNWASLTNTLKAVANIGCESCHGAGSQHALAALYLGQDAAKQRISKTFSPGDCAQCHDSMTHHFKLGEWNNSGHARAPEETSASCSRCHTAQGFANFAAGKPAVSVPYEVITCAACHEPHDATYEHQIRTVADITLMDTSKPGGPTVVTKGGIGKVCMQCHISRRDAVTYAESYHSHYGPHHGPQTDMFVGANAITYGKEIPSSAHRDVVEEACVTCHMQENEGTPSFTQAGGHTFNMKWDSGTNVYELTEACVECHGDIEGFDFKRQDFDGNGVVEGVQTEVRGLLSKLAIMLPPVGVPKPNHSPHNIAVDNTWTQPQLKAAYNYLFVTEDGSYGIHNLAYTVGILKSSIADLSGDANNDGIADWWQAQYFGANWANNPNAGPNGIPANDGVPNWLKFALGLDPNIPGLVLPDGVVWANASGIGGGTNTIHIYTAAEIAFDTEAGKTYQIQSISNLGGGWQNVGDPIMATTTGSMSYVTPTRSNAQQFYRVMHTP